MTIFTLLADIDKKKFNYDQLSTEDKKAFVPFLCLQWLHSSTPLSDQSTLYNDYVNKYLFVLYKKPKLLYDLMSTCGNGRTKRYVYTKRTFEDKMPRSIDIIVAYEDCSEYEAQQYIKVLSESQILEMAVALGQESKDLKVLSKEWKV